MPDILIRGMEMPETGSVTVVICEDGTVINASSNVPAIRQGYRAVELPPHGDLKDANKLLAEFERDERAADEHGREFSFSFDSGGERCTEWWIVQQKLMDAPIIVPASEEATNDPKP